MAGIVLTLAVAVHQPMFPGPGYPAVAADRHLVPPYKAMYFDTGPQSYTLEWTAGQTVDVKLRVPSRLGAFGTRTNTSISVRSSCDLPLRAIEGAEYDPIFETDLITIASVRGVALKAPGHCNITVSASPSDAPYVITTGTSDALFGTMYGSGFPVNLMFVSTWCKNYVYGYLLLTMLPAAAVWHAASPWRLHLAYKAAILVLLATSASRAWQTCTAGLGAGGFFVLLPLGIAAAACKTAVRTEYASALVALAILMPTRSWVDVIALSVAATIT